jgi:hypothetical protein
MLAASQISLGSLLLVNHPVYVRMVETTPQDFRSFLLIILNKKRVTLHYILIKTCILITLR